MIKEQGGSQTGAPAPAPAPGIQARPATAGGPQGAAPAK